MPRSLWADSCTKRTTLEGIIDAFEPSSQSFGEFQRTGLRMSPCLLRRCVDKRFSSEARELSSCTQTMTFFNKISDERPCCRLMSDRDSGVSCLFQYLKNHRSDMYTRHMYNSLVACMFVCIIQSDPKHRLLRSDNHHKSQGNLKSTSGIIIGHLKRQIQGQARTL